MRNLVNQLITKKNFTDQNKLNEFIKYIVVGLINTIIGYGIFWFMLRWVKLSPEGANAIGYIVALILAFLLNHFFVFTASVFSASSVTRFIAAFGIAFGINQGVLFVALHFFYMQPEIAQGFAMIAYTIIFYVLNKWFVFAVRHRLNRIKHKKINFSISVFGRRPSFPIFILIFSLIALNAIINLPAFSEPVYKLFNQLYLLILSQPCLKAYSQAI